MSIHEDCKKKIQAFGGNESIKQGLLDLFEAVSNDAEAQGLPSGALVMCLYDEDSNLQPGDWAAELHIVARKVETIDETPDDVREDDTEPAEEGSP
jgi:hypothetical protein